MTSNRDRSGLLAIVITLLWLAGIITIVFLAAYIGQ